MKVEREKLEGYGTRYMSSKLKGIANFADLVNSLRVYSEFYAHFTRARERMV